LTPEEIISRIDEWRGKAIDVQELGGGITNHNYVVTVDAGRGGKYVLRIPGAGTETFIDREREVTNYMAAAKTGVTPPLLYLIEPACTVVPFIEAETMHPDTIPGHPDRIEKIAKAMRTYHEGAVFVNEIRPFDRIREWAETGRRTGAPRPAELDYMFELIHRIEPAMDRHPIPPTACHLDLMSENFMLDRDGKMWVIDWEYGGMADPYCDLANFLIETPVSPQEEVDFFRCYHNNKTSERLFARMQLYKFVVETWSALWGMMQIPVSRLNVDFYSWGMERIGRFYSDASNPDLERWLDAV
jgi:thiamine kinase-like enzyme